MSEPTLDISAALDAYRAAAQKHADAQAERHRAKAELEGAIAEAKVNGAIEGKNEGEREAHARVRFAALYDALYDADRELIFARMHLDIAERTFQAAITLANLAIGRGTLLEAA